jgi:membrane protein insertase Oxa1/YidC/SpoIIIJ
MAVGIFLVAFALLVYYASRQNPVSKVLIRWIIALDIIWVADSLIVITGQLFGITFIGYTITLAIALWVGLMAYLQIKGLKETLALKAE